MQRRKDNKGRVLKDGEVYRKSDGLYMYRWTAKNGKRHTIYDATLEGLREKEEKIQHDLADGLRIPECSLTLNDLFELWRKNKVGLKEHTFANYVYMYNRFVRDEIGMMKLKDIRKSDIRSYYNGIVRNGKMALNTLETIQNVLHQVFAVAVDDEYIRVNPTDGVLTAIKAAHQYETPKRHALTLPQQQAFLNFIKKTPKFQHWLPMFTFMLGTGCRISETVGLCWSDIDFESGFITIQHNLVYHDHEVGGCYFTMSTPKTAAGKRAIPILPEVRKALEQERTNQQELELVCEYEIDGISDFVFLNCFGQPQNPQTVNRAIKRISVAYNEAELEKAEKEKREPQLLPPFSCHFIMRNFLIVLSLCFFSFIAAGAQENLAIAQIFNSGYAKRQDVEEIILKGKSLKYANLSLFRSVKVTGNSAIASKMEKLVAIDARKASDKEMRAKGGQLVFAFLAFKKEGGEYAYIFFRQSHQKTKGVAAVVYMEGKMTPNEVKRKFLTR